MQTGRAVNRDLHVRCLIEFAKDLGTTDGTIRFDPANKIGGWAPVRMFDAA